MADFYVDVPIRVRYAETDAMGIVHHSAYIVWFEEARSEFMRAMGLPYSEVERNGYYFTVREVHARYIKPAVYDQEVIVRTRVVQLKSRTLRIKYEVYLKDTMELLAEGETYHVCLDKNLKIVRMPSEYIELFQKHCSC